MNYPFTLRFQKTDRPKSALYCQCNPNETQKDIKLIIGTQ